MDPVSTSPEPRSRPQSRPPSGRFRQRGAAAVLAAVSMLMLIPVLALAINIGQLYYAQRDLEKQATLAALSAVQVSSGCVGGTGLPATMAAITAEVTSVIAANSVDGANSVQGLLTGINGSPAIELGRIESSNGFRIFVPLTAGNAAISAVRINLSRPQPVPFINLYGGGGMLYASATAQQAPIGSFSVGSGLLSLNGGIVNGLLGALLCAPNDAACKNSIISLNVINSQTGLVNTQITLGQLGTAVGLSVEDLSNPLDLSLGLLNATPRLNVLLDGLVGALADDLVDPLVVGLLQGLANAATNPNEVPLGQLLGVVNGLGGDTPVINLFDLLIALGQSTVADPSGLTPIALPVNLSVPGVANVSVFIKILEPPQLGIGRPGQAEAKTAQVRLLVRIEAGGILNGLKTAIDNLLNGLLSLVGALLGIDPKVTILPPPLNIGIDVVVAGGSAILDQIQCPRGGVNQGRPIARLSAKTATATVAVGTFSGSASMAPTLNTAQSSWPVATVAIDATSTCVGLKLGSVCLGLTLNLGSTNLSVGLGLTGVGVGDTPLTPLANDVTVFHPPNVPGPGLPTTYIARGIPSDAAVAGNPQTVSSPTTVALNLGLTSSQTGGRLVGVLGGLISNLLNGIVALLNPLLAIVNTLTTALVDPLLALLGIQLGTATVTMNAVQIGQPILVNTCLPGTINC